MNQIMIGNFIDKKRKEEQLAERLGGYGKKESGND